VLFKEPGVYENENLYSPSLVVINEQHNYIFFIWDPAFIRSFTGVDAYVQVQAV